MKALPPVDADVTIGYQDGKLRTYRIKGFVAEEGMKFMGVKGIIPTTESPTPSPISFPSTGEIIFQIGIGIAIYHWIGAAGLIGWGLLQMWLRSIWLRALAQRNK